MTNSFAADRFQHWIPMERIAPLIALETYVLAVALLLGAWLFYLFFLREISLKRHTNLKTRFVKVLSYLAVSAVFAAGSWTLGEFSEPKDGLLKLAAYLGLASLLVGAVVVVRLLQMYLYLYLFLVNMRVGVPRLIVNIFTLVFALLISGWIASTVFGIKITHLLATSAIFSIILGLALQDTLGNLFSGVALQLDKPYQIGDWVEIHSGSEKWVGQIQEISWRATLLLGFSDELISIPNRVVAQSQVLIFSHAQKAPRRNQVFRFPHGAPIPEVKQILFSSATAVPQVLKDPPPLVLMTETTESWITFKLFYSVEDYGTQYRVGDQVISRVLEETRKAGLILANPTLAIVPSDGREGRQGGMGDKQHPAIGEVVQLT